MTGIIVTAPPTVELPPGNSSSNPATLPPVTYQFAVLSIPQTWTAKQTFPLGMITLNAADITGTLPAADLPPPTTITLGGVFSKAAVASQWLNSIGTTGLPTSSRPSFSDISGTVTAAMLDTDVFSTAHNWVGQQTFVAPILGTPASVTLTNGTGLPLSGLTTQAAFTFVVNNTSGAAVPTAVNIASLTTKAIPAAGDFVVISDQAASGALKKAALSTVGGVLSLNGQTSALVFYQTPQIRITLTQGTPVTTADVTAATLLYLEPYNGAQLTIYDGSNWVPLPVASSTYSIPATQTQSGTTHTSTLLDGLTDTSQMVVGQQVTGTNIAANSTISVINSTTSVTMNNAATGSATNTMTFKLPPSTNYDVLAINNSGVPKLIWSAAWSGDTTPPTRALQNGVEVTSGTTTQRVIGSVRTTTVAGQLEDSQAKRYVSNRYNETPRPMKVNDPAATWTYNTATFRQANANTANQLDYICCVARPVWAYVQSTANLSVISSPSNAIVGIGVDSVPAASAAVISSCSALAASQGFPMSAYYAGTPGVGRHFLTWLEYTSPGAGSTVQYFGTLLPSAISGIIGSVSN